MIPIRGSRGQAVAALIVAAGCAAGPASAAPMCGPAYFVERGDTLFGIAERCGTSVAALQTANPELDPSEMRVGMRVAIPADPESSSAERSHPAEIDRASAIAHMADITGVPVQELIASDGALVASESELGPETEYEPGRGEPIRVTGRLTEEGVECPVLRGSEQGRIYSLAGSTDGFGPGDQVTVAGTKAEMSFCMQGTTIDVEHITAAR